MATKTTKPTRRTKTAKAKQPKLIKFPQVIEAEVVNSAPNSSDIEQLVVQQKTLEVFQAMDRGLTAKEALAVVKGELEPHRNTLTKVNQKYEKWSLKNPKNLEIASKTISRFAAGKPVNDVTPRDSTVFAAAQRIVDASEPVVKASVNLNINMDFDPINLEDWGKSTDNT